jgi:Zn-dependent membrane protease YugP
MVLAGIILGIVGIAWLGVAFFAMGTIFALVTLPVEFNASSRAMAELQTMGFVDRTEYDQNKKVLNAAAWTYIAGFLAAAMQLLYYIMLVTGMRRD